MADKWIRRWPVVGTSGKAYTVAQDGDGNFGCDCNAWKMQPRERWVNGKRRDCQHILEKRIELGNFKTTPQNVPRQKQNTRVVRLED